LIEPRSRNLTKLYIKYKIKKFIRYKYKLILFDFWAVRPIKNTIQNDDIPACGR